MEHYYNKVQPILGSTGEMIKLRALAPALVFILSILAVALVESRFGGHDSVMALLVGIVAIPLGIGVGLSVSSWVRDSVEFSCEREDIFPVQVDLSPLRAYHTSLKLGWWATPAWVLLSMILLVYAQGGHGTVWVTSGMVLFWVTHVVTTNLALALGGPVTCGPVPQWMR